MRSRSGAGDRNQPFAGLFGVPGVTDCANRVPDPHDGLDPGDSAPSARDCRGLLRAGFGETSSTRHVWCLADTGSDIACRCDGDRERRLQSPPRLTRGRDRCGDRALTVDGRMSSRLLERGACDWLPACSSVGWRLGRACARANAREGAAPGGQPGLRGRGPGRRQCRYRRAARRMS